MSKKNKNKIKRKYLKPESIESYMEYAFSGGRYIRVDDMSRLNHKVKNCLYGGTVEEVTKKMLNLPYSNRNTIINTKKSLDPMKYKSGVIYIATDASTRLYKDYKLKHDSTYSGFIVMRNGVIQKVSTVGYSLNLSVSKYELYALRSALRYLLTLKKNPKTPKHAVIITDQSSFVEYLSEGKNNKFKPDIKNSLSGFKSILSILEKDYNTTVEFRYVKSHTDNFLHNSIDKILKIRQRQYYQYINKSSKKTKRKLKYYKPMNKERSGLEMDKLNLF